MIEGKILTVPYSTLDVAKQDFWWYNTYHASSGYMKLETVGMDINYKKHYTHGIELRILDWFDESRLQELCRLLIYVADASADAKHIVNPSYSKTWNNLVVSVLQLGVDYILPLHVIAVYEKIFNVELIDFVGDCYQFLKILTKKLKAKYSKSMCSKLML